MSDYASAPPTVLTAGGQEILAEIAQTPLSIFCGRNNSGKSYLMRLLLERIGSKSYYLGPARYFNFNLLTPYNPTSKRRRQRYQQLLQHIKNASQNVDNSPMDLGQAIAELSNDERTRLFSLLKELLGSDVSTDFTVPGNAMSQQYVNVDGYNLAFQSSGFRLAATLLTCLLDDQSDCFIIDEPELGLSPEAQGIIADFLYDADQRTKYFPHIKTLILGTHSPVFLNKKIFGSNYFVSRVDSTIDIKRLSTVQELSRLQFLLLGNRLETLHLPGAIIIGEGACEVTYFNALFAKRYATSSVSVVNAGGDGRMPEIVATARTLLGDIRSSAYHDRLYAILDSVHGENVRPKLERAGVAPQNIIVWSQNGIEHLYPREIMESFYGSYESLVFSGDEISANGKTMRKKDLAEYVASRMTGTESLPQELIDRLLTPMDALLK